VTGIGEDAGGLFVSESRQQTEKVSLSIIRSISIVCCFPEMIHCADACVKGTYITLRVQVYSQEQDVGKMLAR